MEPRASVSIHLDFNSGFRRITPNGPKTSSNEVPPTHGCVLISRFDRPVNPALFLVTKSIANRTPNARAAAAPRRWTTIRTSTSYCSCPSVFAAPAAAHIDRCHHHRRSRPSTTVARASCGPTARRPSSTRSRRSRSQEARAPDRGDKHHTRHAAQVRPGPGERTRTAAFG